MEQIALYHRNSRQAPLDFKHPEIGRYHQQKDQLYFRNIALALNYIYDHDKYKAAVKRGDKRIVYKNKKYEKQAKKREQRAALRRVDRLFEMIEKERKEKCGCGIMNSTLVVEMDCVRVLFLCKLLFI